MTKEELEEMARFDAEIDAQVTDPEVARLIAAIRKTTEEALKTPGGARQLLIDAGIIPFLFPDPLGELR